ncbi:MAG: hypothetical protein GY773_04020 [Actinomycetia bacterium]|nr:hypothetical protein [Actinomycetes bacterium]
MELPRRISTRQLNIERNRPRNELMIVGTAEFRRIGPFTIDVIGPTTEAVEDLEARWRKWLGRSQKALRRLQAEMLEDEKRLSGLDAGRLPDPRLDTALGEGTITAPNLASLVLLIKDESGSTILPTGDGSSEDILTGLGQCEKLDDNGTVHVDILKVQHHGAEANVTEDFVNRVGADHSVFCGNGARHNPEKSVVAAMVKARLGVGGERIGPNTPFTFWFTSAGDTPGLSAPRKEHMTELEDLVETMATANDPTGRFSYHFLTKGHHTIEI